MIQELLPLLAAPKKMTAKPRACQSPSSGEDPELFFNSFMEKVLLSTPSAPREKMSGREVFESRTVVSPVFDLPDIYVCQQ